MIHSILLTLDLLEYQYRALEIAGKEHTEWKCEKFVKSTGRNQCIPHQGSTTDTELPRIFDVGRRSKGS